MSEKVLPQGQQWINMKGEIKSVAKHLAFDKSLQKSSGFFPCDENGVAINTPEQYQTGSNEPQKKMEAADVVVNEPVIEIPKGVDIVLPNEDEAVQENEDKLTALAEKETQPEPIEPIESADSAEQPKKRGRKPAVKTENQ